MRYRLVFVALFLSTYLALGQQPARSVLTARQVIERAIVAHGGYERLAKSRSDRVWLRGTLYLGDKGVPFTNEMAVQLPHQYRSVVALRQAEKDYTVVNLLDGDKASVLINGKQQTVLALHLAQLRQTLQLEQAMRLVPLLTDPGFALHSGQDYSYNGGVVHSVRVQGKSQRELLLYFDDRTGLLVKSEHKIDGPGGKDVLQEAYYFDYKEVGGHKRPCRVSVKRDGKKVMEAQLVDAQRVEQIDSAEFSRP